MVQSLLNIFKALITAWQHGAWSGVGTVGGAMFGILCKGCTLFSLRTLWVIVEIYHVSVLHYVQNKPIQVASDSAILLARHPSRSSTVPRLPHDRHHHYWAPTLVVTRTAARWHLEIGQESAFWAFCGKKKSVGISGVRNVWWLDMKIWRLVCFRPSESLQQGSILLDG